jgi:D-alanyl-D-alanine carboxypeptidase
MAAAPAPSEPIPVYTGPTKTGSALIAAVAVDAEKQAPPRRGRKSRVASKRPDAAASPKTEAKSDAKPPAKPGAVRHASAKPDTAAAKPGEKPAAASAASKPAKPKAAAKPKGETKPAG